MRVIDIPISYHDIVSSASEIPVDENHCKLHRIGRLAIARGKARLAVGPDFQNLRGQFRAELHLLLDDPLPASRPAAALFELRSAAHTSDLPSLMPLSYDVCCLNN